MIILPLTTQLFKVDFVAFRSASTQHYWARRKNDADGKEESSHRAHRRKIRYSYIKLNTLKRTIPFKTYHTPGKLSQVPPAEVLIIGCDRHTEVPLTVEI